MDIGTGIAIAGVWLMVGMSASSKEVNGAGVLFATSVAIGITIYLK